MPLPATTALDPNSAAIVTRLNGEIQAAYGHAELNTTTYSTPIYTVGAAQPTITMTFNDCQHKGYLAAPFAAALQNVPMPANAASSLGSDAEMVIWQPSTDTDWEFWRAAETNGAWSACWGGRIQNVSSNLGIFPTGTGATGSGLPLLGGVIRLQDLESGAIDHAINVEVPAARQGSYSWPAQRTDGYEANADDPAEGERFRFPASLDLSALHLSPGELMIARAIQQYGMIVSDQSGAMSFQAEDPRPYELNGAADPYTAFFSGPQYSWLQGIPWEDLQTLPFNYGEPGISAESSSNAVTSDARLARLDQHRVTSKRRRRNTGRRHTRNRTG
jgi:hypothetical protein